MSVSETIWLATAALIDHRVGVRTLLTHMPPPDSRCAIVVGAASRGVGQR
jgi:hypothetical protein